MSKRLVIASTGHDVACKDCKVLQVLDKRHKRVNSILESRERLECEAVDSRANSMLESRERLECEAVDSRANSMLESRERLECEAVVTNSLECVTCAVLELTSRRAVVYDVLSDSPWCSDF